MVRDYEERLSRNIQNHNLNGSNTSNGICNDFLPLFVIAVTTPECRDNYTCVRIATPTFDNPSIVALIITTGVLGHVARDF